MRISDWSSDVCSSDLVAVREGALLRVRPKAMTVAVIIVGLLPILIGHGTGSEVMSRIAAPMIGGMITAPLLSMLVVPAAYLLLRRRKPAQERSEEHTSELQSLMRISYAVFCLKKKKNK